MAKILIVGSGIVGQATGKGFLTHNPRHEVTFMDINVDLMKRLSAEGLNTFLINGQKQKFPAAKFIMVCISTPPGNSGAVNLRPITEGMHTVGAILKDQPEYSVTVVRSTVPPWTTERTLIPLMEKHSGKKAGTDFGVCMNPEFLRAKSSVDDFSHPWVTAIGMLDSRSGLSLKNLYKGFGGEIYLMRLEEAEFLKYLHNLRNAAVISFYNEMWLAAKKLGIKDPNKVFHISTRSAESAWNSQYGSTGGFPYGGTCLPKDTHALLRFAQGLKISMPLLKAIITVNDEMQSLADTGEVPCAQIPGHNWRQSPALEESMKPKSEK